MRTYEICYSNSMTIPRKEAYCNEKPFYSQKVTITSKEEIDTVKEYEKLRSIIDPLVIAQFNATKLDDSGVRVRIKDGKKYPSVTSILQGGRLFDGNPEYAVRGTAIHDVVNHWAEFGEWKSPSPALSSLSYDDIKYKEFFDSFSERLDFKGFKKNIEVYNDEHFYSGEIDMICSVDGVKTLSDIKTGQWKWEQLVAYWKALNDKTIKQLCIFDLKKSKLEILKVTDEKARSYWECFLKKLGAFNSMFNL